LRFPTGPFPAADPIGTGRIGTFQEPIVIGIARHFKTPRRYDQVTSVFDELEKLLPESLAGSLPVVVGLAFAAHLSPVWLGFAAGLTDPTE